MADDIHVIGVDGAPERTIKQMATTMRQQDTDAANNVIIMNTKVEAIDRREFAEMLNHFAGELGLELVEK